MSSSGLVRWLSVRRIILSSIPQRNYGQKPALIEASNASELPEKFPKSCPGEQSAPTTLASNGTRFNQANIQMLSSELHKQIFPECYSGKKPSPVPEELVKLSLSHLEKHKIPVRDPRPTKPEIHLNLPKILGSNIEEHFWRLGDATGKLYFDLVSEFSLDPQAEWPMNFQYMQGRWHSQAGWTRYAPNGTLLGAVPYPKEPVLVFDVETCPSHGPWPLLAVAISDDYIYGWVSPYLFKSEEEGKDLLKATPRLIPMDDSRPTICIGHNVAYDRARVLDEYRLQRGPRRFLDTMSMHCAIAGLSSQQRPSWSKYKKEIYESTTTYDTPPEVDNLNSKDNNTAWLASSSMNNLADAVKLHCDYQMNKGPRDILVKGTIEDVRTNFQLLMTYCANDVAATNGLFRKLWPRFIGEKCRHPVTFTALLEMSSCFLPVDGSWTAYVERAEKMYQASLLRIEGLLKELVEDILRIGLINEAWRNDPWLDKLDWTPLPARFTKERKKSDGSYAKGGEPRPIGNSALFGKPAWYRKLYSSAEGGPVVTSKTRILPYLLKLQWQGNPVHFIGDKGWYYGERIPTGEASKPTDITDPAHPGWRYHKIPHPEEEGANVGSLMTKHHLSLFEKGILRTESPIVREVMQLNASYSFWVGYRERIRDQFVIWADETGVDLGFKSNEGQAGMILPTMVPMGTVTRRAVERTWMTATNSKKNLVGSELKSKIVAPPGYCFIGADVDSQELWISSLLGDAQFGFAGASALGWMTLQGAKADATDLHSRTAAILGMSRDDAKIFNYGRIYGAGVKYAAQLLQKFNPSISKEDAESRAKALYSATKGRASGRGKDKCYSGGTETFMFNVLEAIACSPVSRTPTLGALISDSLIHANVSDDFMTSRVNWAVQSSGVDYLHMLVAAMSYLISRYGIEGRLSLTIHDEVRYLVAEKDKFRAAFALQIANLWTRAMFAYSVGIHDLPLSVAFFSAVDFDRVLRKEATTDCVTPSNPTPVPPGSALDIYGLLKVLPNGLGQPVTHSITRRYSRLFQIMKPVISRATLKNIDYIYAQAGIDREEGEKEKKEEKSPATTHGSENSKVRKEKQEAPGRSNDSDSKCYKQKNSSQTSRPYRKNSRQEEYISKDYSKTTSSNAPKELATSGVTNWRNNTSRLRSEQCSL